MVRFNAVLMVFLFAATAAAGRPATIPKPPVPQGHIPSGRVLLDLAHLHLFHLFHPSSEASTEAVAAPAASRAQDWSRQGAPLDLSMGPLHPELGQDDNPLGGLSAFEAQDQLGSSAWKEQENKSHSAKLMFVWPTGK
ncbi:MAG TPA: hypothetical protein VGL35_04160 [Rhizomicrobium sp.]|jgi:hypothetical protein